MIKRKEKRINKSLLVNISRNGFERMGVTVNISCQGMCVATTEVFRKRSNLQILVATADDIYAVTGMVVWNMKRADAPGVDVPAGLGIKISDATPGYYKFIAALKKNHQISMKKQFGC